MERHNTKIPRMEPRQTIKTQRTSQDIKTVRFHVPNRPSPLKKSVSLISFNLKYKNLTPEQCVVKYKKHPHIVYKRCCIICGMRRPRPKIKRDIHKNTSNIFTQTTPPTPPPERWNAETQTKKQKSNMESHQRFTQTDKESSCGSWRSLFTCGMCLSIIFVLLCITIPIAKKNFDIFNQFVNKDPRQPKTTMQKIIFYFSRKETKEIIGRSMAYMVVPSISQILICVCANFLLKLKTKNMI